VADYCEHGNKPYGPIQGEDFLTKQVTISSQESFFSRGLDIFLSFEDTLTTNNYKVFSDFLIYYNYIGHCPL